MRAPAVHVSRGQRPKALWHRALGILLGILALLVGSIAALIALVLVDANWLRKPLSNYVSAKLERPFAIQGDVRIGLLRHPHIEVNEVVLGNATWGTRQDMLRVKRAVVSVRLMPLLRKQLVLPEVSLTRPDLWLERDREGQGNWTFGAAKPAEGEAVRLPQIESLRIEAATLVFKDPASETNIAIEVNSAGHADQPEAPIRFAGTGSLRGEAFELQGTAGSLLQLTEQGRPYKVDMRAVAGSTKASFEGTLVPLKMESIEGKMSLSGRDLSKLYPLVPLPLPWTPAYSIAGHLRREAMQYRLTALQGKVGSSDVSGSVALDLSGKRPLMNLDLVSRRLDYKDLLGLLGEPPPDKTKARAPNAKAGGAPQTPDQQKVARQLEATGKLLSPKPYSLERLRVVDAKAKFKGTHLIARDIPLDNVAFALKLDHGNLTIDPLEFGLAKGRVAAKISLDARQKIIVTQADATARNLEVKALMPKLKPSSGSAGKLGGRIRLATKGNSIAQMAASANGEANLILGDGRLSTLALVLTNLDLANATQYILRGNPDAPVYCAVIQASIRDGIAQPNLFVIDSSEENVQGEGVVDFKDEQYDLRLKAKSKRASLFALRGPIEIGGSFKHPKVMPQIAPVAARAGAAVALGALVTPLAALAALIDPGGGKNSPCAALIAQAKQQTAAAPVGPPANADPSKAMPQDTRPESRRPADTAR